MIIRAIHKTSNWLNKLGEYICLVMLIAMIIITGAQIVCRIFFEALAWSEELSRFLLVWASLIGAACVYKSSGHINVSFIRDLLPSLGRKILKILAHIICIAFFIIMIVAGSKYANLMSSQLSPAMRIPMGLMYTSIPVSGVLMLIHAIDNILQLLSESESDEEELTQQVNSSDPIDKEVNQ